MEENKEKKKHGRRRHYRGKGSDKPRESKEQERSAGSEKPAGAEKSAEQEKPAAHEKASERDRSEGSGKRNRHDKGPRHGKGDRRPKQEEKKQRKPEAYVETAAEDKVIRTKREPEEPVFEFSWADSWGLYGTGYHVVIKDNQDKLYLSWSVDLSYGEMKLGQRLQEFLDDMKACGVGKWDGHKFTKPGIFDGDTWSVRANSLTLKCEAQGTNEYPQEWKAFLGCLHDKWKIPVSKREQWE